MSRRLKFRRLYLALLLILPVAGIFCGSSFAGSEDMLGTWSVIGELVTATAENPNDPNAPKPGDIKPDSWKIEDYGSGPVLTGSSGSIQGQYTQRGAVFQGTYPLGSGVYMAVQIEAFLRSASSMYGTIQNDYWGTNTVTGEMLRIGLEAWRFEASK